MEYAIAYLTMSGDGFSYLEPFIHDGIESLEEAQRQKESMEKGGFRQVTIFGCEENELPEFVTWNFVLRNMVLFALGFFMLKRGAVSCGRPSRCLCLIPCLRQGIR